MIRYKWIFLLDSQIIEFLSAIGLLLTSILFLPIIDFTNIEYFTDIHPYQFWIMLSSIFGGLQIYSLFKIKGNELIRALMAWIAGSSWIFFSLISSNSTDLTTLASFLLGIGNLYAFILNVLLMSKTHIKHGNNKYII